MIDLATSDAHPVEVILAYSLSRFPRRLLTQLTTEHRLAKAGVSLITVLEGDAQNDKVLGGLMAEYKLSIASLSQTEANLSRALSASSNRISEAKVREFGLLLKRRWAENSAMRKAYVRLPVAA